MTDCVILIETTLYKEGSWELMYREDSSLRYWLAHWCETPNGKWRSVRYHDGTDYPCERCKSVCPENLQGLYLMMEYV